MDDHVAGAVERVAPHLSGEGIPAALAIMDAIVSLRPRARALAALACRLDDAERVRRAEAILAEDLRAPAELNAGDHRRSLVEIVGGLLPLPRRFALEVEVAGVPAKPPWLWPDLPDEILFERIDRWLSSNWPNYSTPQAILWLLYRLAAPRRDLAISWLLQRLATPKTREAPAILLRLILLWPHLLLPEPPIDRYLELAETGGLGGHPELTAAARQFDACQLDRALKLLEADRSSASGRDQRLEALATVAAERLRKRDPPTEGLRRLLHETLRARSETREEALLVLAAMAPLIVGLGGEAAAVGVVRAIRDAGASWP